MSTSSRIIKNTGYLYIKMGITMFVSLYTTRLILGSLGASDFGIFNVVGGAIAMLGFLNSTMANATQRFMSYAEGEGILENKRKVFNVSLVLHLIIAILTAILLFVAMIPLFGGSVLNIPVERVPAAKVVYMCLIFSTVLTIINVPYDAVMNAHENMLYYSIIGIFEAMLKLGVALVCVYASQDKLILYGILMALIPLITLSIMKVYCHKHYEECVISPHKYWDKKFIKNLSSFFGWNFLTAITSLISVQGIGIVLNHFFGAVLNAAHGISTQLSGYMQTFSTKMVKATNPVIVKNAGARNYDKMNKVSITSNKFSTYLVMIIAVPCIIEMPFILKVWLKEVPNWTVVFCTMQLLMAVIMQMCSGASTAIYAIGDIKGYAIYKGIMNALPILLTYFAFSFGGSPLWLYIPMIVTWAIGGDIVIIIYAKKKCGLYIKDFLLKVICPVVSVFLFMVFLCSILVLVIEQSLARLIFTCLLSTMGLFIGIYLFGASSEEKKVINNALKNFAHRS